MAAHRLAPCFNCFGMGSLIAGEEGRPISSRFLRNLTSSCGERSERDRYRHRTYDHNKPTWPRGCTSTCAPRYRHIDACMQLCTHIYRSCVQAQSAVSPSTYGHTHTCTSACIHNGICACIKIHIHIGMHAPTNAEKHALSFDLFVGLCVQWHRRSPRIQGLRATSDAFDMARSRGSKADCS